MRFGQELRQERERRGISLDDVAVSTRVSLRHLHALEDSRFSELPRGVFSRGIVRSYAQHCGLDTDGTLRGFIEALRTSGVQTEEPEDAWVELAEAVRRNRQEAKPRRKIRWVGVLLMILGVLLLAAGVACLLVYRGVIHLHLPERLQYAAVRILGLARHLTSKAF